MDNRIIISELEEIFKKLFNIPFQSLQIELYHEALLGKKFNLSASDLLCLYMEVEKRFSISISEKEVARGNFNNINNIISIIANSMINS